MHPCIISYFLQINDDAGGSRHVDVLMDFHGIWVLAKNGSLLAEKRTISWAKAARKGIAKAIA